MSDMMGDGVNTSLIFDLVHQRLGDDAGADADSVAAPATRAPSANAPPRPPAVEGLLIDLDADAGSAVDAAPHWPYATPADASAAPTSAVYATPNRLYATPASTASDRLYANYPSQPPPYVMPPQPSPTQPATQWSEASHFYSEVPVEPVSPPLHVSPFQIVSVCTWLSGFHFSVINLDNPVNGFHEADAVVVNQGSSGWLWDCIAVARGMEHMELEPIMEGVFRNKAICTLGCKLMSRGSLCWIGVCSILWQQIFTFLFLMKRMGGVVKTNCTWRTELNGKRINSTLMKIL